MPRQKLGFIIGKSIIIFLSTRIFLMKINFGIIHVVIIFGTGWIIPKLESVVL